MKIQTVGLVACSKQKGDHYTWAKDLYQSPLFKLSRLYAEKVCDSWCILSARHGVVMPDQCLWPYECELSKLLPGYRREWMQKTCEELMFHFVPNVSFCVLAGAEYAKCVPDNDRKFNIRSHYPLEGMGIGKRLGYLKHMVGEKALKELEGPEKDIPF